MAKKTAATDAVLRELRAFGLAYPGAHTKSPWPGHLDLAVQDRTFAYLNLEGEALRVSCKLPRSAAIALVLPFVKPAAYGLGKSGWVAADLGAHPPDVDMLKAWIDESYRAQAPKKLLAAAPPPPAAAPPSPAPAAAKEPAARKPAARKPAATKAAAARRPGT
jgi:predicted DNA-binding protein (MmcQ/YjbR family)